MGNGFALIDYNREKESYPIGKLIREVVQFVLETKLEDIVVEGHQKRKK